MKGLESMGEKLSAVLVGCGSIAGSWLGPVAGIEDLKIVGLVDLNPGNAENLREKFKLQDAAVGTDLRKILSKVKPDLVFDCTVPCAHPDVTITALRRGCHVLGEKPLAENMKDARRMIKACEKSGRIYSVIQNRRYQNNIICYRDAIKSGRIGELTTLNADFYLGPHFGGFREQMKHVLLVDMAIHSFDQARLISGLDPVSVYCHDWNPKGSWFADGASAVAIFEMTGGVVFCYRGSWCAEGMNSSWECEWRAVGSKGSILWDGKDSIRGQAAKTQEGFIRAQDEFTVPVEQKIRHLGHEGLIREFVECVRSGGRPQTECHDNIRSLAMVHAAVKSAETGKKVKVEF